MTDIRNPGAAPRADSHPGTAATPALPMARARAFQTRAQSLAAAGGVVAPIVALLGLFGSGVMPPDAADQTAQQIAEVYTTHGHIRIAGLLVGFLAIGLLGPLVTVISGQLRRIETAPHFGSTLQLVAGTVTWVLLSIPLLILVVAAYRTDRNPEITQALQDLGWILFLLPVAPFLVQNAVIALVILSDTDRRPIYPRWVAYANVFIGASFLPDLLLGYFFTGPLAYHGVFCFWIPTVTYGLWLVMMGVTTWQAVTRQGREPAPAASEAVA
ncbi:MAG TPA: hypothetical protein VIQ30_18970 [Pseudonocardia sp.]